MRSKLSLILLLVFIYVLHGEVLRFSINYLGIGVVDVQMEDETLPEFDRLTITAKSTSVAGIFVDMDNIYISEYRNDYLPLRYIKDIRQDDYREDRTTQYDRMQMMAYRESRVDASRSISYPIEEESRDFFSALYHLRWVDLDESFEMPLDANSLIWKAKVEKEETEEIRTALGKLNATRVRIDFYRATDREKERSDMLTNNLVNEEVPMYIWFTCDERRIPIKAKFASSPFSVTWTLTEYQE